MRRLASPSKHLSANPSPLSMDHHDHKHRPPNTSFKQQRLKAWQPILTAKVVLPIYFIIGILFAPLGGLLMWQNEKITEISFDYTGCDLAQTANTPAPHFEFKYPKSVDSPVPYYKSNGTFVKPVLGLSGTGTHSYVTQNCTVTLTIPADIQPPVMMYYRLTNFYQNHRSYVKSLDYKQLKGQDVSAATIKADKGCQEVTPTNLVYPCGLIANSVFNDTISGLIPVIDAANGIRNESGTYQFASTGIAWASDSSKFGNTAYPLGTTIPPSNWAKWPAGVPYSADYPPPDLHGDEHFQVWMRTAGWPTFLKLYGRNDNTVLTQGQYQMDIEFNYPIASFGGTKSIVFSSLSVAGGNNAFLGIAFIVTGMICAALGIVFTALHVIKPRVIGDHSKISFGGEATVHTRGGNRGEDGGNRIRSRYEDD